jgi:hypothetical protein
MVGWNDYPPGGRDKLVAADFGSATFALKDSEFDKELAEAKRSEVPF